MMFGYMHRHLQACQDYPGAVVPLEGYYRFA